MTLADYRDRQGAKRILDAYGKLRTFTRWAKTKDRKKGSQTWGPDATIDPIETRAALVDLAESRDRGVSAGDQMLVVAGTAFAAAGLELTDDWRLTQRSSGSVPKCSQWTKPATLSTSCRC